MKIKEIVDAEIFRNKIRIDMFKKILQYNLNVNSEKVLIMGDKGYKTNLVSPILTNAYSLAAEELGLDFQTVYQNFKGRGDYADEVEIRKLKELPKKSVIIINVSNRIGKLDSLGLSFRKFAKGRGHRFVSSSSLGSIKNSDLKIVLNSLDVDYKNLSEQTHSLMKKLTEGNELHVQTKAGTDMLYNIEGIESKGATGIYRNPREGGNLPASEAYIAPNKTKVEGRIAIDGSLRIKNKTVLIKSPVLVDVHEGMITKLNNTPEAKLLNATLMWAHNKAKYPEGVWRIGEFGIGLNKKAKIIGSTIIDEKAYGTGHFAIGSNAWFGGDIKSIIHLDQVIKNPIIKLDGRILKY